MKHLLLSLSLVMTIGSAFATNQGSNHHNTNVDTSILNSQQTVQGQMQGQHQDATGIGLGFAKGGSGVGHGGSSDQTQTQSVNDSGNSTANATGGNSDQSQTQQANNAGNAQNVNFNQQRQFHNTPSMPLFVPSPTATCMATIGGAGAGAGFGFSISGTYRSMHCEKVELAKSFNQMGQTEAALQVLCNVDSDHIDNVDLCDEVKQRRAEHVASRKAAKEPIAATTVPASQEVAPDQVNAEVADASGNAGLFRFDTQTKQWVFAGGSFFGRN